MTEVRRELYRRKHGRYPTDEEMDALDPEKKEFTSGVLRELRERARLSPEKKNRPITI